jgi:hypothetical protein
MTERSNIKLFATIFNRFDTLKRRYDILHQSISSHIIYYDEYLKTVKIGKLFNLGDNLSPDYNSEYDHELKSIIFIKFCQIQEAKNTRKTLRNSICGRWA